VPRAGPHGLETESRACERWADQPQNFESGVKIIRFVIPKSFGIVIHYSYGVVSVVSKVQRVIPIFQFTVTGDLDTKD